MNMPPVIGDWYQTDSGTVFEVVAIDPLDATIEVQLFDGSVDEYDLERWDTMLLRPISEPGFWYESYDLMTEDMNLPASELETSFSGDPLVYLEHYRLH